MPLIFMHFTIARQPSSIEQFGGQTFNRAFTETSSFGNKPVSVFSTTVAEPVEIITDSTGTLDIDHAIITDNVRHELTGISEGSTGFRFMLINVLTIQLGGQLEQRTEQRTATIIKFPMNIKGGLT